MSAEDCVLYLRAGQSVVVEAIPGAGKSRALSAACADARDRNKQALVLAYNAQLASELSLTLPSDCTTCLTFHALCSRVLRLVRDDEQLQEALDDLEAGTLALHDVPHADLLCIDEAQDVRPLFVRLLRCCDLLNELTGPPLLVCGDRHQLLYDFDPTFPASLQLLCETATLIPRKWKWMQFARTWRLTPPVAELVHDIFRVPDLTSALADDGSHPPIEVRTPRSRYDLVPALRDLFEDEPSVLVLANVRKNNHALRLLSNHCARGGRKVHVHSFDPPSSLQPGVTIGSFWTCKGLQAPCVVVLAPDRCAPNPLYVALTRSSRRLIVVLDSKEPHAALGEALLTLESRRPGFVQVVGNDARRALVNSTRIGGDAVAQSLRKSDRPRVPSRDVCEGAGVARSWKAAVAWQDVSTPAASDAPIEDPVLQRAVFKTALVHAEAMLTRTVGHYEDVVCPLRRPKAQEHECAKQGIRARLVSGWSSDADLLADDLRARADESYARLKSAPEDGVATGCGGTPSDSAVVALACDAFGGYDHLMRRMLPVLPAFSPHAGGLADWIVSQLPPRVEFDVVLADQERYGRVFATCDEGIIYACWETGPNEEREATALATLHLRQRCCLFLELATRCARAFDVTDPSAIFA